MSDKISHGGKFTPPALTKMKRKQKKCTTPPSSRESISVNRSSSWKSGTRRFGREAQSPEASEETIEEEFKESLFNCRDKTRRFLAKAWSQSLSWGV